MSAVLPNLAVVIPTLNEEGAIASCLHAVGTPPGAAIVVTDGGSTDATLEIVARERPEALVLNGAPGRGVSRVTLATIEAAAIERHLASPAMIA